MEESRTGPRILTIGHDVTMVPVKEPEELAPRDRVGLLVPGSRIYLDVVLSLLVRGIIPVPMDPHMTEVERRRILPGLDLTLIVDDPDLLEPLDFGWSPGDLPLGRPMHLTSGTTGTPKGVWSDVLSRHDAQELLSEETELWGFNHADRHLLVGPVHHSAPLRFASYTLLAGGQVVGFDNSGRQPSFDPAFLTQQINDHHPTSLFGAPTHIQRLFRYWETHGQPDLSSFRLVAHAGAPCPESTKRRLIDACPPGSVWEFYGSTEGQFTTCSSKAWEQHPGTVGRARPGRKLRVDEQGQFWCATPEHARFTYFNDPEKTAAAWAENEFTVGDLGRIDADGFVYLDGRRDDLIISGGVNVYPTEVEQVLGQYPGVVEVAVFAQADDEWGQRVCVALVGEVNLNEIKAYARSNLTPAKRPKTWHLVNALPRTPSGKIQRQVLADGVPEIQQRH